VTVGLHPLPAPDEDDRGWIYERYHSRVYRFALRKFGPRDAEDIAQEAMARCYARADSMDLGRDLWPWLCTVAHNVGCDIVRSRLRDITVPDETLDALRGQSEHDASEEVVTREEWRTLNEALRRLSASDRLILRMREIEELGFEAIGDFLGMTANNARQRVFRARLRLGRIYTQLGGRLHGVLVGLPLGRAWLRRRTSSVAPRMQELAPLVSSPAVCLAWAATIAIGAGVTGIGGPGASRPGGPEPAAPSTSRAAVAAGWQPRDHHDRTRSDGAAAGRPQAGGPPSVPGGEDPPEIGGTVGPARYTSRLRHPSRRDEQGETDHTRIDITTPLGTTSIETNGYNPSGGPDSLCLLTGVCPELPPEESP